MELLHIKHTRYIKSRFEYLADRRLKSPKSSWGQLTAYNKAEMKDSVEKYCMKVADVSEAFSKLTRNDTQALYDKFMKELKKIPELTLEDRLS